MRRERPLLRGEIRGDDWRVIPAGPGAAPFSAFLYTGPSGSGAHPYSLRRFPKLGWQAWWNNEPASSYVMGDLREAAEKLVMELRVVEVEEKLNPSLAKRIDFLDAALRARARRYKELAKQVDAAMEQPTRPVRPLPRRRK